MSNRPDIYEAIKKIEADTQVLQIAISLLCQKLYPTVKIDKAFWEEVERTHKELFEAETEELKDEASV